MTRTKISHQEYKIPSSSQFLTEVCQGHADTFRRVMNKHEYGYQHSQKKALVTDLDRKKQMQLCCKILKENSVDCQKNGIASNFDRTNSVQKKESAQPNNGTRGMNLEEKIRLKIKSKEKKRGHGCKVPLSMVQIKNNREVIAYEIT